jgi:hypothetical protein
MLKADETVCFTCGSARKQKHPKPGALARVAGLVKILFIASAILTVASLFLDATPSFTKCFATTVILLFVNRSAEQMLEKQTG